MRVIRGSKQFLVGDSRYHLPDGKHDEFVWASRILFLEAIQKLVPHVLVDLRDTVLYAFQRIDARSEVQRWKNGKLVFLRRILGVCAEKV